MQAHLSGCLAINACSQLQTLASRRSTTPGVPPRMSARLDIASPPDVDLLGSLDRVIVLAKVGNGGR